MILLSLLIAAGSTSQLKPFEFRTLQAGKPLTPEQMVNCKPYREGLSRCPDSNSTLAGVSAYPTAYLYNGMLNSLIITSKNENYDAIRNALLTKYGKPCESRFEKWQSKGGVSLDNRVETWCFSTGHLQLSPYGSTIDYIFLAYADSRNRPQTTAPKVDF